MKADNSRREKINSDTQKIKYWKVKTCLHDGGVWKWFLFWEHGLCKKQDLCKWDRGYQARGSCPGLYLEPTKVSLLGGPPVGAGLLLPSHPLSCPNSNDMPLLVEGVLPWTIFFLICWRPFWATVVGGGRRVLFVLKPWVTLEYWDSWRQTLSPSDFQREALQSNHTPRISSTKD